MTRAGRVAPLLLTMAVASACGPLHLRSGSQPKQDLIVLLPDDGGTVGRAVVSNPAGTLDLTDARGATRVAQGQAPTPVQILSERETQEIFGDALAALPQSPQYFTLFFRFESEELTDESRKLVLDVIQTIRNRQVPDVIVLGHTDTTGTAASNFTLGLQRANMLRALLIAAGLDASAIQVLSSGESDLLVRTADDVFEPKNRRVEISVR